MKFERKIIFGISFALFLLNACTLKKVNSNAAPVSHEQWTALLQKHVNEKGNVHYGGFVQDSVAFNSYLELLKTHHPNDSWASNEKKAYWINTYNAFTIKLIVDNYPVVSIKDLGGAIYKVNTPWDNRFILIEGHDYDLNNIEHDILRKEWTDARIHFAVNCASISCPKLLNVAFNANSLDKQLDKVARRFINGDQNDIQASQAQLSRVFKWFNGDFTRDGSLIEFLNNYSDTQINTDAELNYQEYDWLLNGQ
ncbi:MAG: hypothetical protein ACI898_002064 [Flavobacteriales bacterium]|jgi:hypothetical protein